MPRLLLSLQRSPGLAVISILPVGREVYDPQTDGWQPLAKMTTARLIYLGWPRLVLGGKIYAIGGWAGGSTLESVEAYPYDPQLGSLALVASVGGKRRFHASVRVVLDGKIKGSTTP